MTDTGEHINGADRHEAPRIKHDREAYTTSTEPLRRFLKDEGMSNADFGRLIGVSVNTPTGWLNDGRMPKYMLLVLEGLKRRRRAENERAPVFLVAPGAKAAALEVVLKSMDLEFIDISTLGK
jgi:hypothetical protein